MTGRIPRPPSPPRARVLALLLPLLLVVAMPAHADNFGVPDIEAVIRSQSVRWRETGHQIAAALYKGLFTAELLVTLAAWWRVQGGWDELLTELVRKALVASVIMWLVLNPNVVLQPLIDGLSQAGAGMAASGGVTVADLQDHAMLLGNTLVQKLGAGIFRLELWNLVQLANFFVEVLPLLMFSTLVFVAGWLAIVVIFLLLIIRKVVLEVEGLIVLTGGLLFVGFGSFRLTAGLAEGYLRYAVQVGIHLFFFNLMLGIGKEMMGQWIVALQQATLSLAEGVPILSAIAIRFGILALVVGSVAVWGVLAFKVPSTMAARLTGDLRIGLSDMIRGR